MKGHTNTHIPQKILFEYYKGQKTPLFYLCVSTLKHWLRSDWKGRPHILAASTLFIESTNTRSVCLNSILSSIKHWEGNNIYVLSKRISRAFSFNYRQISYALRADNKGVSLPHCCGVAIRMESLGPECVCVCVHVCLGGTSDSHRLTHDRWSCFIIEVPLPWAQRLLGPYLILGFELGWRWRWWAAEKDGAQAEDV